MDSDMGDPPANGHLALYPGPFIDTLLNSIAAGQEAVGDGVSSRFQEYACSWGLFFAAMVFQGRPERAFQKDSTTSAVTHNPLETKACTIPATS